MRRSGAAALLTSPATHPRLVKKNDVGKERSHIAEQREFKVAEERILHDPSKCMGRHSELPCYQEPNGLLPMF